MGLLLMMYNCFRLCN